MTDSITALTIQALLIDQLNLERVGHNIVNIQTPGFKRQIVANGDSPHQDFQAHLRGYVSGSEIVNDMRPGAIRASNNSMDIALAGRGYFELNGERASLYTRRGDFHIDNRGRLVSVDGWPVMGRNGEITLSGDDFRILPNGEILQNGQTVNFIKIVDLPANKLVEQGGGNFISTAQSTEVPVAEVKVHQGFLESSNVSTAQEMVQLTTRLRHFEGLLRLAQARDEMLGTVIRRLGE